MNLLLQSEAEQQLEWRRYRQLLTGLTGPVSIYSCSRPDLALPERRVQRSPAALATAEEHFRSELVAGMLIQRQQHLVAVWAGGQAALSQLSGARELIPALQRGQIPGGPSDLEQRVEAVQAALSHIGLRSRRLGDGEWLELLQRLGGGESGTEPQTFAGWIAPRSAAVGAREVKIGEQFCRSLSVSGYPRRMGIGWMAPLLRGMACELRAAQHILPLPKLATLARLRRKIRGFETSLTVDGMRGSRGDVGVRAALGDALSLEESVLLEEERLFQFELCLTVAAEDEESLEAGWGELRSTLGELGCDHAPLTHRQADGWRCTVPLGCDPVGWGREMTASALATAFPFIKSSLSAKGGVLLGPSLISRELVQINPFDPANPNFNVMVLGTSGAGKSYSCKLLATRLLLGGGQLRCIDPVGEYRGLARLLEGQFLELGPAGAGGLNPLGADPGTAPSDPGALEQWAAAAVARAQPALELLASGRSRDFLLSEEDSYCLERALSGALLRRGWPITLPQLVEELHRSEAPQLARRLERYTEPVYRGLFGQSGGWDRDRAAVVFSLEKLTRDRDQLLPPVMQVVLSHLEAEIQADPRVRRMVLLDEAETLLSRPRSAEALESLSRRIRKWGAGLMVVSQVVQDFLGSPVGNVIIRNCHTKLLLRQEEVALAQLREVFGLSSTECDLLRDARPGAGLVIVGRERAAFQGVASPELHPALLTDARPQAG